MTAYHLVGWVEPAIPIAWHAAYFLGIAALNPTYESPDCIRLRVPHESA